MAQQGHFNPVQVDLALNHPLKCLVIGPVIGKEVSKPPNHHHFAPVIYNRPLPIIEDWFPRNGNFLARNPQFSLRELNVSNLYFTFKMFNSEQKVVNTKMSNHHGAVGSEKTRNY